MIYIACPANCETGGPEALYTLAYELKLSGKDVKMFLYDSCSNYPECEKYKRFQIPFITDINCIDDIDINIIIIPETKSDLLNKFKNIKKYFWWLSVDNFEITNKSNKSYKGLKKYYRKLFPKYINNFLFKDKSIIHLVQSKYAFEYVKNKGVKHIYFLQDYLSEEFLSIENIDYNQKENIVLYNPKKGYEFTKKLISKANNTIKFIPLENLTCSEVRDLLLKSKIYIDFGNHPGKDRFPREAAMCGNAILTNKKGAAKYNEDVPINKIYKMDDVDNNIDKILEKIFYIFENYEQVNKDFEDYRKFIKLDKENFKSQVNNIFIKQNENKMKTYIKKIFSIKNEGFHKVINIMGLKIKIKRNDNQYVYNNIIKKELPKVRNYIKSYILASQVNKNFEKYRNIYKNNSIIIFGSGPSLTFFELEQLPRFNEYIKIGINTVFKKNSINFDYLFIQDTLPIEDMNAFVNYKPENCKKMIGYITNDNDSFRLKQIDYNRIKNKELYILNSDKEDRIPADITLEPFADIYGTVFSTVQFALHTQAKNIYLVGFDCNKGFANLMNRNYSEDFSSQKNSWIKIKQHIDIYYPYVEVISVNPAGLKGLFKDVYTQSYVDAHPELLQENIEIIKEENINA